MLVQTVKAILFMGCCGVTLGMIHSFTKNESVVKAVQNATQKIYLEPSQIAVEKSGLFIDLGKKLKPIEALYYDGKRFYVEEEAYSIETSYQHLDGHKAVYAG
jgi:hypothetical protein